MKLLIIILNKTELLDEILTLFLELGITGATVVDSIGMGEIVSREIPIFAGFRDLLSGSNPTSKTILTVVKDELVAEISDGIEKSIGDFSEPGMGIYFTVSIEELWGYREEI